MCVKVIASQRWDFFETRCIRCMPLAHIVYSVNRGYNTRVFRVSEAAVVQFRKNSHRPETVIVATGLQQSRDFHFGE